MQFHNFKICTNMVSEVRKANCLLTLDLNAQEMKRVCTRRVPLCPRVCNNFPSGIPRLCLYYASTCITSVHLKKFGFYVALHIFITSVPFLPLSPLFFHLFPALQYFMKQERLFTRVWHVDLMFLDWRAI
jgi:hypothetical protein